MDNLLRRGQLIETWTTYWDLDNLLRHGQLTETWATSWDMDNLLNQICYKLWLPFYNNGDVSFESDSADKISHYAVKSPARCDLRV